MVERRPGRFKIGQGNDVLDEWIDRCGSEIYVILEFHIDEAGQMSLANVLAISQAATSSVLLGDPQQLDQPQKGIHPPAAEGSAFDRLLRGHATVTPDQGLFLTEIQRLHPGICAFTSELFYNRRPRLALRTSGSASTLKVRLAGQGSASPRLLTPEDRVSPRKRLSGSRN